ncbi:15898_t:CDS:2 [Funneliformis mosseae]|uniref:15898_t:CDS:1 n=1 Tax=Funneliformis mosseae TaxID=27381 RepID=A0A9N9EE03_FUNMO|nr:15898_t:CDS:2 [Funneliformis mosseae]
MQVWKGTSFNKKLAYRCMDANTKQRPSSPELMNIFNYWYGSIVEYENYKDINEYEYYGKEIKEVFEEADKEIANRNRKF